MNSVKRYFTNMPMSAFIAALCVFLLSQPYFVWGLFKNNYIRVSVLIFCCILFAKHIKFDSRNNISMFFFWMVTLVLSWYTTGQNFIVIIPFLSLLFIPFASISFSKKVFNAFYDIIAVFLTLSVIFYILYCIGFPLPSSQLDALNQLKSYNYTAYPFFVIPNQIGIDYFRFCAFWDEPGCVGTYTILMLGANRFKLNGWKGVVMIISGILSMSFFFFSILFILGIYKITRKDIKKSYRIISCVVITILMILTFSEGTILYELVGWRFEYDSAEHSFAGDNRTNDFAKDYLDEIAWKNESFFWGVKDRAVYEMMVGGSSYISSIFRYGFIAFAMYMLFFIISAYRNFKSKTDLLIFIAVFAGCVYQRPGIADIVYVLIYTMWIKLYDNSIQYIPNIVRKKGIKRL